MKDTTARIGGFIILMVVYWLVLSGYFDAYHLTIGVYSIGMVAWLYKRLLSRDLYPEVKPAPHVSVLRFFVYYMPWLTWQVIKSCLHVTYVILSPRMPVDVSVLRFKTNLPTMASKVVLGTSITLTPGTLTLDISGDEFWVHALTEDSAAGIVSGAFPAQTGALFGTKGKTGVMTQMKIIRSSGDT